MRRLEYVVTYADGTKDTVTSLEKAVLVKAGGGSYRVVCTPIDNCAKYNEKRMARFRELKTLKYYDKIFGV